MESREDQGTPAEGEPGLPPPKGRGPDHDAALPASVLSSGAYSGGAGACSELALPGGVSLPAGPGPGAPPPVKEAPPKRAFGSIFEVALVVLLALFLALILKIYVAEAYEIRGRSMEPTFQEEQRVMILKVFYGIQRGDIIIFSSVDNPAKDLIKRVIGLPGDVVEMRRGKVFVNGGKLDEPYVHPSMEDVKPEKVQPGKYYVLGDNRPDSMDSRKFHPIDASSIKGKVILRWWPLEKLNSF